MDRFGICRGARWFSSSFTQVSGALAGLALRWCQGRRPTPERQRVGLTPEDAITLDLASPTPVGEACPPGEGAFSLVRGCEWISHTRVIRFVLAGRGVPRSYGERQAIFSTWLPRRAAPGRDRNLSPKSESAEAGTPAPSGEEKRSHVSFPLGHILTVHGPGIKVNRDPRFRKSERHRCAPSLDEQHLSGALSRLPLMRFSLGCFVEHR